MLEYQNTKMFLQKVTLQIGQKKFLPLKRLKTLFLGHMLLVTLKEKELLERFMKKNCKKRNHKEFRIKKVIEKKGDKLYIKWKGYDIS